MTVIVARGGAGDAPEHSGTTVAGESRGRKGECQLGTDMEHTARAANAIAQLAVTDEEQERVRAVCRNIARFKLG